MHQHRRVLVLLAVLRPILDLAIDQIVAYRGLLLSWIGING